MDEIFIIEPFPDSLIKGRAYLQPKKTESKFTLCIKSHVSESVISTSLPPPMPALFTKIFREPVSSVICFITDCHCASLVTSNRR